jgi:hypothetical protein
MPRQAVEQPSVSSPEVLADTAAPQTLAQAVRFISQRYEPQVALDSLVEHPENPRRGNDTVLDESVDELGFYGAIYGQASTRRIVAGNHRLKKLRRAGATSVDVIWLDIDDALARKILLVDNRANDLGTYDMRQLHGLLDEIARTDSLRGTGYSDGDLGALVDSFGGNTWADSVLAPAAGAVPEPPSASTTHATLKVRCAEADAEAVREALTALLAERFPGAYCE